MRLEVNPNDPLSFFIVVMLSWRMEEENPCNVLNRSGSFSRMPATWDYRNEGDGSVTCTVRVDGKEVARATKDNKQEAR